MRRCFIMSSTSAIASAVANTTAKSATSTVVPETTTTARFKGSSLLGEKGPDPNGLREFSVVYTDRAVNHMSKKFQGVMNDLHATMTKAFNADSFVIIPGAGTYAMEAVARQFVPLATKDTNKVMILRNGFFSFRWTQIFDHAQLTTQPPVVVQANQNENGQFLPAPIDEVVAQINTHKPQVVFAPIVDTSDGIMLSYEYIKKVTEAVRANGGIFVLDCIASGMMCPNMKELDVDVIITAPQKGWSGQSFAGFVLLNERAKEVMAKTQSSSFTIDLNKWLLLMNTYLNGAHMYHATMPTDAICAFHQTVKEIEEFGIQKAEAAQIELGKRARELIKSKGYKSVAADEVGAPGVIVLFTDDEAFKTGKAFVANGYQIAGGVPLQVGEGPDFKSFRFGLFGMDKLKDIDGTLKGLEDCLNSVAKN